uniref:Uncharacterized protein n=1 Tax=viral metagenome TaxID=1070528 RepID=A0A6H1ZAR8_9ZZZZ
MDEKIDAIEVFETYFSWIGKPMPDCVSFSLKRTTFKKTRQLFADDFYVISNAALRVAADIKRRKVMAK